MAPVQAYLDRVRELVEDNRKFEHVHPFLHRKNGPTLGTEGHVKSEVDLAALKRLVEATKPTQPVHWSVRVSP